MCRQSSGVCRAHPEVGRVDFIAREQALAKLKRSAGLADVLADLERNPLPTPRGHGRSNDPATLEALRDQAARWPKVEHVQLDAEWARRLDAALEWDACWSRCWHYCWRWPGGGDIQYHPPSDLTRRDEIEVSKLIGATNPFPPPAVPLSWVRSRAWPAAVRLGHRDLGSGRSQR